MHGARGRGTETELLGGGGGGGGGGGVAGGAKAAAVRVQSTPGRTLCVGMAVRGGMGWRMANDLNPGFPNLEGGREATLKLLNRWRAVLQ